VFYVIACAAPPAMDVHVLIDLAQQDGWDVCLIATPRAFQWLDVPGLAGRTGHPVRHDYKLPGEPDVLPEPDAIIVAPATFNTINKWAAGIAEHPRTWVAVRGNRQGPARGCASLPECRPG
jgi:phosphopantothenoylcysteine decarboxylase